MMKKTYIQPRMVVVQLQQQQIICQSVVKRVSCTDDGISYGGGGSGESYTRESRSTWDDEW